MKTGSEQLSRRIAIWSLLAGIAADALLTAAGMRSGLVLWLIVPAIGAALLVYRQTTDRSWPATLWLVLQFAAITAMTRPPSLLVPAAMLSLVFWDLDGIARRLRSAPRVHRSTALVQRHLAYLGAALLVGGGLAVVALVGSIQLRFLTAAMLVIALLLGLNWLMQSGRRDPPPKRDQFAGNS